MTEANESQSRLRDGEIIRAPFLPGPARVKKFEPRRAFTSTTVQRYTISRSSVPCKPPDQCSAGDIPWGRMPPVREPKRRVGRSLRRELEDAHTAERDARAVRGLQRVR